MENHKEEVRQLETTGETYRYFLSDIVVACSTMVRTGTMRRVQSKFKKFPRNFVMEQLIRYAPNAQFITHFSS